MTTEISGAGYDPFAAEVIADPFPHYAELRDHCPVHRFDGYTHPLYTATRYDDVVELLTTVETWSSRWGQMPTYEDRGCLFSDPPVHTMYRKIVQQSFGPRHVARMEPEITALVGELLDAMEARGHGDLHDDLACPLPVLVIAKILGVPTADLAQFKQWSDDQLAAVNSPNREGADAPRQAMNDYFLDQIAQRRSAVEAAGFDPMLPPAEVLGREIPDDVMSGLLVAEVDGRRLDQRELLIILNQLLVGGNETTTSLITNLFWRLLDDDQVLATLRADPALDTVAVEESLRLDAPVIGLYRTAVGEQSIGGVTLEDRDKIMATFAAANRDPQVFADPDRFRLDRDPEELRKHVAFGLGHHFCPGAQLSRVEARIALRRTLDRFPNLRAAGPSERIAPYILWGRKSLPVSWQ